MCSLPVLVVASVLVIVAVGWPLAPVNVVVWVMMLVVALPAVPELDPDPEPEPEPPRNS